jgi:hypothetical protein
LKRFDGASRVPRKDRLPSPERVRADVVRTAQLANDIARRALILAEAYPHAYDAAFRPASNGDGIAQAGRSGWSKPDPTGDTALSAPHREIRWACRHAAREMRLALERLEDAETDLVNGFFRSDPDVLRRHLER